MLSDSIKYDQSDIHFLHFGKGPINIVCLHGYGESAASFVFLDDCLPPQYCVIAIDLPFHGTTKWTEGRAFTNADMVHILDKIFKTIGIQDQNFTIMGYSMGGRIALSLLEYIPQRVTRLVLLAPDGMKVNFWYWLATQTRTGNRLFRITMNNPKWFFRILRLANRLKLINKSVFKFVKTYINDEKVRQQLFHRWTCMRSFKPNLDGMRVIIQQKQLPVRMLYGEHDRIILSGRASKFRQGLESLCEVHIIDAGHQLLQKNYAAIIIRLLIT